MLLYHYCSVDTFLSIIRNKTLWLTDLANTNDTEEIRYGMRQLYKFYEELTGRKPSTYFDQLLWFLNRGAYASCFSEEGDLLSQWRGYADDGKGFSIGFDFSAIDVEKKYPQFTPLNRNNLLTYEKVLYEYSDIISIIDSNVLFEQRKEPSIILPEESILRALSKREKGKDENDSLSDFDKLFLSLGDIAFFMKNPAFKEEKEWRFLYKDPQYDSVNFEIGSDIKLGNNTIKFSNSPIEYIKFDYLGLKKHYSKNDQITSYYEYDFSAFIKNDFIKKIFIGPKSKANENNVAVLMSDYGFIVPDRITIEKSKASYR